MMASTTVSQLLARWAHLYGHTPVSATVTYLHLVGILVGGGVAVAADRAALRLSPATPDWSQELARSEEHTSELQSRLHLVCRLLLEKKKPPHTPLTAI